MITFLAGGTGTPKLIQGFREIINDKDIAVIANSADDIWLYGLYISPDIDTILYLFSGLLDEEKYWGIKKDTYQTLDFLKRYNEDIWFNLGDKDLALHLFRTKKLRKGEKLSLIIDQAAKQLGISAKIFPSSEKHIETRIVTKEGEDIHFQEFWVKHRGNVSIDKVYIKGIEEAIVPSGVLETLDESEIVIIGPSNPITSIGPIVEIDQIRSWFQKNKEKCIAISPVVGGSPLSGPTAELMKAEDRESTALGVAQMYKNLCSCFIVDNQDKGKISEIEQQTGLIVEAQDIIFKDINVAKNLAKYILQRGNVV
ncbi:MAG: 2-phospho-L-lactate transferase [Candidatus Heimdallarchaeota archaeon]|nr:2-phospho-L-lactate transferase [Candidatus Heimdallarchaeota archaeon]MCK4878073.1 2-phospho-L-lactate transferase [Candidatus Heimdallarchaeota archaeon]